MNEFEYIMNISHTLEPGKWVAVIEKDMVVGDTVKEVLEKIRSKHPSREPFVMKVPDNATMLL